MEEEVKRKRGRPPKNQMPAGMMPKREPPKLPEKRKAGRPKLSDEEKAANAMKRQIEKYKADGGMTEEIKKAFTMYNWSKIDFQSPDDVRQRIAEYMEFCANADAVPTYPGFAISLGISSASLTRVLSGAKKVPDEVREELTRAVDLILSMIQSSAIKGKLKEITSIFLMKSQFGLRETTSQVITVNNTFEGGNVKEIADRYANSVAPDKIIDVESYTVVEE